MGRTIRQRAFRDTAVFMAAFGITFLTLLVIYG